MTGFQVRIPPEDAARARFYRAKADEARERAHKAFSTEGRQTFRQIAESYENLARAVEDIARKRSLSFP
jgi:hypothetical protein